MTGDCLSVYQIVRLKGMVGQAELADALGLAPETVGRITADAVIAGDMSQTPEGRCRLMPAGHSRLESALAQERASIDQAAVISLYQRFRAFNKDFKALVTRWQMRSDGSINDHSDTAYDQEILRELNALHGPFAELVGALGAQVMRLNFYRRRFETALARVSAGDTRWFGRPLIDSYHTVWFELHEDLLRLCGLEREAEEEAAQ
jgi:hypothetical protein